MIKLLALDLDKTLLRDDRSISYEDIEALRQARAKGVGVTIATGRMFAAAHKYAHQLETDVPIITYQGSLIKNLLSEKIIRHLRISKEIAQQTIQLAQRENVHINVYIDDELYVIKSNPLVERYAYYNGIEYHVVPELTHCLLSYPTKVVFVEDNEEKMQLLLRHVKQLFESTCDVTLSLPHLLEVGHKEGTKSQAIAFLANRLAIKREEVMAIGDGINDLDMLSYAGIGVAMGNASNEVKEAADWITADNNSSGVAAAIEKYIL